VHSFSNPSGPMVLGSSSSAYFLNNKAARSGLYGSSFETEICGLTGTGAAALGLGWAAGATGAAVGGGVGTYTRELRFGKLNKQMAAYHWRNRFGRTQRRLVIAVDSFNVVRREAK
jgi:hypothetical protein